MNVKTDTYIWTNKPFNTYALAYNSYDEALKRMMLAATALKNRCASLFECYPVVYWQDFVSADPTYLFFKQKLRNIYTEDAEFRQLIEQEVAETYTAERAQKYPGKELYLVNSIYDELEQRLLMLVGANKGYYALLYPGKFHQSWHYIRERYFKPDECLQLVEVKVNS